MHYFIAVSIIWVIFLITFLLRIVGQCFVKKTSQKVLQKGLTNAQSFGLCPEFELRPIFSHPSNDFNMKNTSIVFEILHQKPNDEKMFKIASIPIDCSKFEEYRDLCLKYYGNLIILVRRKSLPPITQVRASHNSGSEVKIFFEGVEVFDTIKGELLFYAIKEMVQKSDIQNILQVKSESLQFFSKETFCPTFYCLTFETFGEQMIGWNTNGIIIRPKLNFFEVLLFFALLINLTFALMSALLVQLNPYLKDNRIVLSLVSVFGSSLTSLLITELFAIIYRNGVKKQLNKTIASNESKKFWFLIQTIILTVIFVISLMSTIIVKILIIKDNEIRKILKIEGFDETILLLQLLVSTLVITASFGVILFGVFRYLFRLLSFGGQKNFQRDPEKGTEGSIYSEASGGSTYVSTASDRKAERKERGETLEEIGEASKKSPTPKSPKNKGTEKEEYDEKGYKIGGKRLTFNTERLDREAKDTEKTKRLSTNSVIAKPTNSKGYENPEDFRLTQSKIDKEVKQMNKKKKK